jgi:hypothetical protein
MSSTPPFTAQWTKSSAVADLERWVAFLAAHGVAWTPTEPDRAFVTQVSQTGSAEAPRLIELRLSTLAHEALARAGDARRLAKLTSGGWLLLSPEARAARVAAGESFEKPPSALASLITIPITLGAYFGAATAAEALGAPREVAGVAALVVYVIAHRLTRGRWPLQRPR